MPLIVYLKYFLQVLGFQPVLFGEPYFIRSCEFYVNRRMLAHKLLKVTPVAQLGGEEADAQSVSLEVDASVKEGNDPLPRTPQSWLHFRYIDVSEQATALRHRKLQGDGVRAVAALVAQVCVACVEPVNMEGGREVSGVVYIG
jgi:hypothetical protein